MASKLRPSAKLSARDGDGNHIHNLILLDLPPKERELLFPKRRNR
jgi:hypothetical protein